MNRIQQIIFIKLSVIYQKMGFKEQFWYLIYLEYGIQKGCLEMYKFSKLIIFFWKVIYLRMYRQYELNLKYFMKNDIKCGGFGNSWGSEYDLNMLYKIF